MNTRQLQYAIQLSKSLNFSQVAEQLNISQPALSKQILNLENELGVKLFNRNTTPLTLTPAGEHFILEAQELLYKEEQLLRSMESYKSGKNGRLVIGISPFRSLYLIPPIIKKIQLRFPDVQVFLHEAGSSQLRRDAAEGKYDFAIVNLPVDDSVLDIIPLEPDILVLAVPNHLTKNLIHQKSCDAALPSIHFKDCKDLPFVVVGSSQEMRHLFDKLCASADFRPKVVMEVVGLSTAWMMTHAGIGATLLPLQFVNSSYVNNSVSLFALNGNPLKRQPVIISKRGQYLSEYAKYAIELLSASH